MGRASASAGKDLASRTARRAEQGTATIVDLLPVTCAAMVAAMLIGFSCGVCARARACALVRVRVRVRVLWCVCACTEVLDQPDAATS